MFKKKGMWITVAVTLAVIAGIKMLGKHNATAGKVASMI